MLVLVLCCSVLPGHLELVKDRCCIVRVLVVTLTLFIKAATFYRTESWYPAVLFLYVLSLVYISFRNLVILMTVELLLTSVFLGTLYFWSII